MNGALPRGRFAAGSMAMLLASLVAFSAPVMAQSLGGPIPGTPSTPWGNITVIVISPPGLSPYEKAQQAEGEAPVAEEPMAEAEALPDDEPDHGELVQSPNAPAPSIWNALTLGTAPTIQSDKPAPNTLLPARKPLNTARNPKAPRFEAQQGGASVAISSSASATAPVSSALNPSAGGGSGEIKGRVGYEKDNLSIYTSGAVGAAASSGAPSVYDNLAVGSTYNMPLTSDGSRKLGTSVEINNAQTVTTGVELTAPLGPYERFISVQRSAPQDSNASGVVKAGVLGKF